MKNFNEGTVTLRELSNLSYDLKIINMKSPKIFEIIVDYFMKNGFKESQLLDLGTRSAVNFFHSIYFSHPKLVKEDFFQYTRRFAL